MRIWIVANVGVTSYTLTVQKGGVSQTITKNCAVNAGTGILYKDDVNTFTTVDDDLIGVEVVTGANGAFTPAYVYVTMVLIPS